MPGYNTVRYSTYAYGDNGDAMGNGRIWIRASDNSMWIATNRGWQSLTIANPANYTGPLTVVSGGIRITGAASINGSLTVASVLTVNAGGLTVTAGGTSFVGAQAIQLGTSAVASTNSAVGLVLIPALGASPVANSVPTTGTVYVTFNTVSRSLQVNIAGSWFSAASMSMI